LWIVAGIDTVSRHRGVGALASLAPRPRPGAVRVAARGIDGAAALLSLRVGQLGTCRGGTTTGSFSPDFAGAVYASLDSLPAYPRGRSRARVDVRDRPDDPHRCRLSRATCASSYARSRRRTPTPTGHSQRTALVAVQLGLRHGVDEDTLRAIARGAYLHDVGKISIPDEILNKAGSPDARRARGNRDASATRP
jgi:HD-GYP domain-containing protein (c-di-GMP phosphodiesterase class II)